MRVCWMAWAVAAAMVGRGSAQEIRLIPMPREVKAGAVVELERGVRVTCNGCAAEDQFAAENLQATLRARGVPVGGSDGVTVELERAGGAGLPRGFSEAMRAEGYTITITGKGLRVTGATAEGLFYGAQTVKQMVTVSGGRATLQQATVRDWPAMRWRGQDDDLSRGPVPTLEFQKRMVETLSAYKVNIYSPYFEQTMQYASHPLSAPPNGSMSAADARELVAYARQFHVTVIPEQEAFGHLRHTLVWEEYRDLAETPHGAVLAPGQPGSVALIQDQFAELAKDYSGPFLHLGADETEDLGQGQTKADVDARGLGAVYLDFMSKIVTALQPLNRRLLFWGDIAMHSPDLVKAMPASFKQATIAVPWEYNPQPKGFDRFITPFTNGGFETWVAPGVNNWSRVFPNFGMGMANIQGFVRDGQRLGATGELNTIWNDDGEGLVDMDWFGILFGAAAGWQEGESSIPQFERSYGQVFHGDGTGKLNEAQRELMAAHALLRDQAKTGDASDGLFWIDPWSKDGLLVADKIRPYTHDLRLHAERAMTLIAQARAAAPASAVAPVAASKGNDPANTYPSNPTSLRETDAIDAMELGARRMDFIGLKFQLAEEMEAGYVRAQTKAGSSDKKVRADVARELYDINGVNGRITDIKDAYSLIRDLYEQAWRRTNRPYGLRPVLEHYDYTIGLWLTRSDRVRSAQRQWDRAQTLPSASDLGIPAPPAGVR